MTELGAFEPRFSSDAHDVSDDGAVISGSALVRIFGDFEVEATRWTEDTGLIGLGFPTGQGLEISGDGNTIGGFAANPNVAFGASLWTEETGTVFLHDLLQQQGDDLSEWQSLSRVTGISRDGLVVTGVGTNIDGNTEYFIARLNPGSIPEPGSTAIIAACFSPIVLRRRRK